MESVVEAAKLDDSVRLTLGCSRNSRRWLNNVARPALERKGVWHNVIFPAQLRPVDAWLTTPVRLTDTPQVGLTRTVLSTQRQPGSASFVRSRIVHEGGDSGGDSGGAAAGTAGASAGIIGAARTGGATAGIEAGIGEAGVSDVVTVDSILDSKARGIMKSLIPIEMHQDFVGCHTAQDMWNMVEDWASQWEQGQGQLEAERAWYQLRISENEGVYEYMHRARNIALDAIRADSSIALTEEKAVRHMLHGLLHLDKFHSTALKAELEPLTFEFAVRLLRKEELVYNRRALELNTVALAVQPAGNGGGSGSPEVKGRKFCSHCKKPGHSHDTCFQLHPQLKQYQQKNKRLQKKVNALTAQLSGI